MKRRTEFAPSQPTQAGNGQPSPQHLDDMLDSLSDGFMSLDKAWCFTYLNHTA